MIGLENYYKAQSDQLFETYDEVWVVMRYKPKGMPDTYTHVPALSPSRGLFTRVQWWKRKDEWNTKTFVQQYLPSFVAEMRSSAEAYRALGELISKAMAGKSIALMCTCYYEHMCHTAILAAMLERHAPDIEVRSRSDFKKYWQEVEGA